MSITVPVSELKQRTGKILSEAVVNQQDIIVERYGQDYAVILSKERYQALLDSDQARIRERFLQAQQEVYEATADIPEEEMKAIIAKAITESRRERAGLDESHS